MGLALPFAQSVSPTFLLLHSVRGHRGEDVHCHHDRCVLPVFFYVPFFVGAAAASTHGMIDTSSGAPFLLYKIPQKQTLPLNNDERVVCHRAERRKGKKEEERRPVASPAGCDGPRARG